MRSTQEQLYSSECDVFLRELVQNGCDAITVRKLAVADPDILERRGRIDVFYDERAGKILVRDNGIGVDPMNVGETVLNVFENKVSKVSIEFPSLPGAVQTELKRRIIGKFGIGMFSAFRVADSIMLFSRRKQKRHWEDREGEHVETVVRWCIIRYARLFVAGEETFKAYEERVEDFAGSAEVELLNDVESGTVVSVFLKRGYQVGEENHIEQRVWSNAGEIASARRIVASLQKYFLYLPADVDIYVDGRMMSFKEPELGYCDLVVSDTEGDVSYKIGIPSFTTISQKGGELVVYVKGVLVQSNYQRLLPDFLHSIRGFINIVSDQYTEVLARTRETFIEQDKLFLKLKDLVHTIVVNACSRRIDEAIGRPLIDVSNDRSADIVKNYEGWAREKHRKRDADYALKLFGTIVYLKVYHDHHERDMSLREISDLCRKGEIKKIYFMVDDYEFVTALVDVDKIKLYTKKTDHIPFFLEAKKEGNVAFISYRSAHQQMPDEVERVLGVCNEYLAKVGNCPVRIKPLTSDMVEASRDIPQDMESKRLVYIDATGQPGTVFLGCNPMNNLVYVNKNADVMSRFLKLIKRADKNGKKLYADLVKAIATFKLKDALEAVVVLMGEDR
ncbi:MAG: ATP-binding protein [Candidatus Lokiarchaeota archaeon]|nr:ATP-binding protein [Candidatus Lokiarchaeota archaeon]